MVAVVANTNTKVKLHQTELRTKQQEIDLLQERVEENEKTNKSLEEKTEENKKLQQEIERLQAVKAEKARIAQEQARNAVVASPQVTAPSGSCQDWIAQAGVSGADASALYALIMRESGCRVDAQNPTSPAFGIPQSLPGSKMASHGADWQTNPVTQIRWMVDYCNSRYGGIQQANNFQIANNWY